MLKSKLDATFVMRAVYPADYNDRIITTARHLCQLEVGRFNKSPASQVLKGPLRDKLDFEELSGLYETHIPMTSKLLSVFPIVKQRPTTNPDRPRDGRSLKREVKLKAEKLKTSALITKYIGQSNRQLSSWKHHIRTLVTETEDHNTLINKLAELGDCSWQKADSHLNEASASPPLGLADEECETSGRYGSLMTVSNVKILDGGGSEQHTSESHSKAESHKDATVSKASEDHITLTIPQTSPAKLHPAKTAPSKKTPPKSHVRKSNSKSKKLSASPKKSAVSKRKVEKLDSLTSKNTGKSPKKVISIGGEPQPSDSNKIHDTPVLKVPPNSMTTVSKKGRKVTVIGQLQTALPDAKTNATKTADGSKLASSLLAGGKLTVLGDSSSKTVTQLKFANQVDTQQKSLSSAHKTERKTPKLTVIGAASSLSSQTTNSSSKINSTKPQGITVIGSNPPTRTNNGRGVAVYPRLVSPTNNETMTTPSVANRNVLIIDKPAPVAVVPESTSKVEVTLKSANKPGGIKTEPTNH